ncbi:MAG TPA: hypothetical protein VHO47_05765 [Candidatus Babeliales bacterium]|nr:hypothetical protein [Candidatus Babeliales bacterium]
MNRRIPVYYFLLLVFSASGFAMEKPRLQYTKAKRDISKKTMILQEESRIFGFIKKKNPAKVKECLENLSTASLSSDFLIENETGNTPLIKAVKVWEKAMINKEESKGVLRAIITHSPLPDPTIKNKKNQTAIDCAKNQKLKKALETIAHGKKEIEQGQQEITTLLAEQARKNSVWSEEVLGKGMEPQPDSWDEPSKKEDSQN